MDIKTIDLNFLGVKHAIAAYLVTGPSGRVLIECGPGSTLKTLLDELAALGVTPADVDAVLVTHIHFDHAGAAGWWAQQGVPVYVHPNGARHLIDPARLYNSARRIYGDQMEFLWGEMRPAPEDKVHVVNDGDVLHLAGLTITAINTPGHANHHHAYRVGSALFTGDVGGVRVPGSPVIAVPAPPPEFDLEAWLDSIDRLLADGVDWVYPTHFGGYADGEWQLRTLRELLPQHADLIRTGLEAGTDRDVLLTRYVDWLRREAVKAGMDEKLWEEQNTANPLFMAVDGISRYWKKQWEG